MFFNGLKAHLKMVAKLGSVIHIILAQKPADFSSFQSKGLAYPIFISLMSDDHSVSYVISIKLNRLTMACKAPCDLVLPT